MSEPHCNSDLILADKIVAALFCNGAGKRARRLVLELPDSRDGGGWSHLPAVQHVARVIADDRREKMVQMQGSKS